MYADRLEGESKESIQDRLYDNLAGNTRRNIITGKRRRQDDKWEHDLFQDDDQPQISRKLGGGDLRLKLQRKSIQRDSPGGARDLREKLSGLMHPQPAKKDLPKTKPEPDGAKLVRRSVIAKAPMSQTFKVSESTRKKAQQQVDASVDGFLHSLGLEKYLITFQAEEVDMTALEHMTDEDLKAIGIPMGPRKKILLALSSRG